MRDRLGSILLSLICAVVVAAFIAASYFSATSHSDTTSCKNQVYELQVIDDLAQTARVLVSQDKNLDPAIRTKFVTHYNVRHRQIVTRLQASGCYHPKQGSRTR